MVTPGVPVADAGASRRSHRPVPLGDRRPVGCRHGPGIAPARLDGWARAHPRGEECRQPCAACRGGYARRCHRPVPRRVRGTHGRNRGGRQARRSCHSGRPCMVVIGACRSVGTRARGCLGWHIPGRRGPGASLWSLPANRWQELEVHLVDLGIGVTFRDWPEAFVAVWLPRLDVRLSDRIPSGHDRPDPSMLSDRERLAWLYGRLDPPGFPDAHPMVMTSGTPLRRPLRQPLRQSARTAAPRAGSTAGPTAPTARRSALWVLRPGRRATFRLVSLVSIGALAGSETSRKRARWPTTRW